MSPELLHTLVPIGSFVTMTMVVWIVLGAIADRPSGLEQRLSRLIDPAARKKAAASILAEDDRFQARMTVVAGKFGQSFRPKNETELGKAKQLMLNAGFRSEHAVAAYYGVKVIGGLLGLLIGGPVIYAKYGLDKTGLSYLLMCGAVGFYLPGYVVGAIRKKRMEGIFLGLPDAIDLMVVCIEAGLGFDTAMRRVTQELARAWPVLCEEFSIALFQAQMGRSRKDVLRDLGVRTGVDDMRSLAAVVIQAERFGSSIGSALRVQSESMRTKRRQLAEERAAKTAVKIMIPLVLFIFPGVFVVLVGPAGMQIASQMMK
ncbi:MAG TPA: type II secretion system F family protein [Isosphaeraceae bacterium]